MEDRREIEIVLENVFDNDWELLLDVYQRVNQPNFKLCLDIGHAHCYSTVDARKWAENLAPYVSHVHVHDNCGDRDSHIGLGKGNLPWKEVLKLLPQDQGRTWTIECMKKRRRYRHALKACMPVTFAEYEQCRMDLFCRIIVQVVGRFLLQNSDIKSRIMTESAREK